MPNRPPAHTTSAHLKCLDGWRGLAILFLLIGHFFPVPGINLGTLGVNFFFVLSGWLMTRLLFIQNTPIDEFYKRRIARIVPTHVTFIFTIIIFRALNNYPISAHESIPAILFANNYFGNEPGQGVMPFGHIWSLSVEEHSYILLSILAIATRNQLLKGNTALWITATISAICAALYPFIFSGPKLQFNQWMHTEVAGYGIFISGLFMLLFHKNQPTKYVTPSLSVLVVIGVALHWWKVPLHIQKIFGVGAIALALNLLPFASERLQALLAWKPLRLLGIWSFSLYIWQQPFYLWSRNGHAPTWVGLLLSFIVGLASFYVLEDPARRLLNRTWGRKKARLQEDVR